jgi:oligopeptide transport system substrate-binding protein
MKNLFKFLVPALMILAVWFYGRPVRVPQGPNEKVLVTASEANIQCFDPAQIDDMYSAREVTRVYEGLLAYHYLKRPYELVPNLAALCPLFLKMVAYILLLFRRASSFMTMRVFLLGKAESL